jgi:O-antigen/teichoic acid export membrane protein
VVSVLPSAGRTVTRNVFGMLTARVVTALAGLAYFPVVYQSLGVDEFGVWVLLSGVITMLALVDLGLGSAVVRQVAATIADPAAPRTRATLGVALAWGVVLAAVAVAATMIGWPWLSGTLHFGASAVQARTAWLWLLLGLLLDGVAMPWRGVLEGNQRYAALAWTTCGTALLGAALAIAAVRLGGGLAELGVTVGVTSLARSALVVGTARRVARSSSPRLGGIRPGELRDLAGYGLRVQVTSASGAVNMELDRFILGGFFGPAVAGGFDLGGRLVNLLRLPPAFALMALFPLAVSRTAERGQPWLDRFNVVVTKYLTAFAALGAACLVVCADPLIRLWLGEVTWWAAANVAILAPCYALNLASGATAIVTRVEGLPGRETGYALLSGVLNLALTYPLLRLLGPTGVPVATAVGVAVSTVYFMVSYHRITGRPIAPVVTAIWPSLLAAVTGACAAALASGYLPDGPTRAGAALAVASRGGLVLLVAGMVLAATGFVRAEDRARLRRVFRQGLSRTAATPAGGL